MSRAVVLLLSLLLPVPAEEPLEQPAPVRPPMARAASGRSFYADRAESLLHPWILRRVGVHGRATVIDGFGAQFVVPGLVAVDLA